MILFYIISSVLFIIGFAMVIGTLLAKPIEEIPGEVLDDWRSKKLIETHMILDGIDKKLISKEKKMNINDFAVKVTKIEGKAKQCSIAQVKEILKIVNELLNGALYKLIRKL